MSSFDTGSGSNKKRKVSCIVSDADRAELERHHRFLPPQLDQQTSSTWQERMAYHYHQNLYKDYVLADLTRASRGQVGLRWRTQAEVETEKGSVTCGNKHCPSYQREAGIDPIIKKELLKSYFDEATLPRSEQEETTKLSKLPYGMLTANFEVPFTYREDNTNKMELVKLRLCARCAPLLFLSDKGQEARSPSLAARRARIRETDGVVSHESNPEAATTTTTRKSDPRIRANATTVIESRTNDDTK